MKRNLRYTALLLFMLSTVYASAQSLRKLMKCLPRIIESKWEQTSDGGTELNYYNEDLCSYYLFRENDRSYNLNPGKNTVFRIEKGSKCQQSIYRFKQIIYVLPRTIPQRFSDQHSLCTPVKAGEETQWQIALPGICQNNDIPNSGRETPSMQPAERRLCDSTATAIADIPPRPHFLPLTLMMHQNFIPCG